MLQKTSFSITFPCQRKSGSEVGPLTAPLLLMCILVMNLPSGAPAAYRAHSPDSCACSSNEAGELASDSACVLPVGERGLVGWLLTGSLRLLVLIFTKGLPAQQTAGSLGHQAEVSTFVTWIFEGRARPYCVLGPSGPRSGALATRPGSGWRRCPKMSCIPRKKRLQTKNMT